MRHDTPPGYHIDADDLPTGYLLSRREALTLLGGVGVFDDAFTDSVFLAEPYASKGIRTLRNDGDGIYQQSGGQPLVSVTQVPDGYQGTFQSGSR